MKKNAIRALVACGLLSVTLLHSCVSKDIPEPQATPITIADVLTAHNVIANPKVTSVFIAEGQRTVSFTPAPNSKQSGTFLRLVTLARYEQLFRYESVDPSALVILVDLFDGSSVHHAMAARGKLMEASERPGYSPPEAVGIELKSLGLLPVLGRLLESTTESSYQGLSDRGLHKIKVRVSNRTWTLYANSGHLIRRIEFLDNAFEYDDYRELDGGVRLPFKQRFFARGKLHYQLVFTRINLKPAFSSDYFSREAMLKDILR